MGRNPTTIAVSLADGPKVQRGWENLVRFATWTRIDLWGTRKGFAERLGLSYNALNKKLAGSPSMATIAEVQRCLLVFAKEPEGPRGAVEGEPLLTPVLTSLYAELSGYSAARSSAEVEPAWFMDLCVSGPPRSSVETFVRGEALRSMLQLTRSDREREALLAGERRTAAAAAINDLLAISGAPARKGVRAVHLLAHLAPVALPRIEEEIWQSPVGYRSVRILGRILRNQDRLPEEQRDSGFIDVVGRLLLKIDEQRPTDAYPGRSLWVECMRWAPQTWAWVEERLKRRALDPERPVRERMYAAVLLHRRQLVDACDEVVDRLRTEGTTAGKEGLAYTAAFLDRLLMGDTPETGWFAHRNLLDDDLSAWPPGRPEVGVVNAALRTIRARPGTIPPASVDGMRRLVAEAALQPDGTRRRRAAEVLDAAGLGEPAVDALRVILHHPDALPWQKEQAMFVIGQLHAANSLEPLQAVVDDPGVEDAVLHAALWAIGDICGTGRPSAHHDPTLFQPVIRIAATALNEELRWAATYVLAMGRQPYLQEELAKLRDARFDRVTRAFALWGEEVYSAERARHRPDAPRGIASNRTIPRVPE
jgi:hypothetical protein